MKNKYNITDFLKCVFINESLSSNSLLNIIKLLISKTKVSLCVVSNIFKPLLMQSAKMVVLVNAQLINMA
jgi:hypothetical protein